MTNADVLLQERLARLESGEALEACLTGLPQAEAELVRTAALLREFPYPEREAGLLAAQRRRVTRSPQEVKSMTTSSSDPQPATARPRWVWPAALLGGAAAMLLMCALVTGAVTGGALWLRGSQQKAAAAGNPAARVKVPDAHSAVLAEARGVVEGQTADGAWQPLPNGAVVAAGQRLRTGALSSVALVFYDGSVAGLGPQTELTLDTLDARRSGPRVVLLTQWVGDSDHTVTHSDDPASRYEVNTPSGSGSAKGTVFHVLVTTTLITRINVDEGAVAVTNLSVTVIVVAGASTTVVSGEAPQEPVFRLSGEGEVTQTGSTWGIGGRSFLTNSRTIIVGNPQVGDWVAFEGRVLSDGTRFADQIVLVRRAAQNRFALTGTVASLGEAEWTVAGRAILVDAQTSIEAGIAVGDRVSVEGVIATDGTFTAATIRLVEAGEPGLPFEIVGALEAIGDTEWTISGLTLAVNDQTEFAADLTVGEIVKVKGWLQADGTRLARSFQRVEDDEREFEFTGSVDSRDPWVVAGISLATDERTEIDAEIGVGDRVKVKGRILEDGTWLAEEIELKDEPEVLRFKFVGLVTSIDPWVVGGQALTVDEHTKLDGRIALGDLVKVKGVVAPDGSLVAQKIKRLKDERGCLDQRSVVRSTTAGQIILLSGQSVELGDETEVEGAVNVASIVLVQICTSRDGGLTVVRIIVIYQLEALPTPAPRPDDRDNKDHHDDHDDHEDDD